MSEAAVCQAEIRSNNGHGLPCKLLSFFQIIKTMLKPQLNRKKSRLTKTMYRHKKKELYANAKLIYSDWYLTWRSYVYLFSLIWGIPAKVLTVTISKWGRDLYVHDVKIQHKIYSTGLQFGSMKGTYLADSASLLHKMKHSVSAGRALKVCLYLADWHQLFEICFTMIDSFTAVWLITSNHIQTL